MIILEKRTKEKSQICFSRNTAYELPSESWLSGAKGEFNSTKYGMIAQSGAYWGAVTSRTQSNASVTQPEFAVCVYKRIAQELPSHTHTYTRVAYNVTGGFLPDGTKSGVGQGYATGSTGGDQAHSIIQPEFAIYMYKRTSQELPKHSHAIDVFSAGGTYGRVGAASNGTKIGSPNSLETGSEQPHNNVTPEFVCYMYKRLS